MRRRMSTRKRKHRQTKILNKIKSNIFIHIWGSRVMLCKPSLLWQFFSFYFFFPSISFSVIQRLWLNINRSCFNFSIAILYLCRQPRSNKIQRICSRRSSHSCQATTYKMHKCICMGMFSITFKTRYWSQNLVGKWKYLHCQHVNKLEPC